jgi:carboxypeptidase Taq
VHWSHGSFGYFATYSIGSLYAAQLYAAIMQQNPSLERDIATGENANVVSWLKQHIYQYGRYYSSNELCRKATGDVLNADAFIGYATKKYSSVYDAAKK